MVLPIRSFESSATATWPPLEALAKKVGAGIDPGDWPVHHQGVIHGVKVRVSCSAVRRLESRKLPHILGEIAEHWDEYVGDLAAV